jgi:hypothetical protein
MRLLIQTMHSQVGTVHRGVLLDVIGKIWTHQHNALILFLVSLTNETYQRVGEEFKSCLNATLHIDLDLNENVENNNGLVGLHMFGSFFTVST